MDGISGVDIMNVMFDLEPDPPEPDPGPAWYPRPEPSGTALLADALSERAGLPLEAARAAVGLLADPREATASAARAIAGLASMASAGFGGAPASPLNTRIGPHRRFDWADGGPRAIQGDQGRARRNRQRRRADGRDRRAARAPGAARRATPRARS